MDKKVIKRNGNKVNFDETKIFNAIYKATMASHDVAGCHGSHDEDIKHGDDVGRMECAGQRECQKTEEQGCLTAFQPPEHAPDACGDRRIGRKDKSEP